MRRTSFTVATVLALTVASGAMAQEGHRAGHDGGHDMSHAGHAHAGHAMSAVAPDSRELVDFPSEVRDHQLRNMREHFKALSDILASLATGDYEKAAEMARTQLGEGSLAATGCKSAPGGQTSMSTAAAPTMHERLARHMPEGMSALGMSMHRAADDFAAAATEAARTGDAKPAYAALSRVTASCIGCHDAYRTR